METVIPATLGLILAGGLARRMGGTDKALIKIGGIANLERVRARLHPACRQIIVSANGEPARFAGYGLPVVADSIANFAGPLAGILAGMEWAAATGLDWVVSVPADCPFLPYDLVDRLHAARRRENLPIACACSGERRHPVVALWPTSLRAELRRALLDDGVRKIAAWTSRYGVALATWPDAPFDPFFNVNTPDDLAEAERIAAQQERV